MRKLNSNGYFNAYSIYSEFKINQKRAQVNRNNYTRAVFVVIASLIGILLLASCANGKSNYHFSNSEDALSSYHAFLSDVQQKKNTSSTEMKDYMTTWIELRDTVFNYISKDPYFSAHAYLPSRFFEIHDSIKTEMLRLAASKDRTLKDVLLVKEAMVNKEERQKAEQFMVPAQGFFATLDTVKTLKTDCKMTLILYRKLLSEVQRRRYTDMSSVKQAIREEDVLFRAFLSHINEYADVPLADLTESTEQFCKLIAESQNKSNPDSNELAVYLSMRTNRRLIQNAEACMESMKRGDKLSESQKAAYYWMMVQPFVAMDSFGVSMLTPEQEKKLMACAEEVNRMEKSQRFGTSHKDSAKLCGLVLKLNISTL